MDQLFGVGTAFRMVTVVVLGFLFGVPAMAAEVDQIFFRVKTGVSLFSNLDPVTTALAVGLDLGFRSVSGFGLSGTVKFGLQGSASTYVGGTVGSIDSSASTRFLGIVPTYSVNKGSAALSFGVGVGSYAVTRGIATGSGTNDTTT